MADGEATTRGLLALLPGHICQNVDCSIALCAIQGFVSPSRSSVPTGCRRTTREASSKRLNNGRPAYALVIWYCHIAPEASEICIQRPAHNRSLHGLRRQFSKVAERLHKQQLNSHCSTCSRCLIYSSFSMYSPAQALHPPNPPQGSASPGKSEDRYCCY